MNKNLQKLADKARFVNSPEYPDQDVVFQRFAQSLIIEIVGNIYRNFPTSKKAEKLVEEICIHYGMTDNDE